jgi:hypothetical protein
VNPLELIDKAIALNFRSIAAKFDKPELASAKDKHILFAAVTMSREFLVL